MSISKTVQRCAITVTALASTFAISQPAFAAGGNVAIDWSIPDTPASGLTDITFPLTVNPDTAHQTGLYFAQEFGFKNTKKIGYTGLQPRPDSGGHERLHGVFSYFGAGVSSSDSNCSTGADGGDGVSCAVDFDGVYGHTYALKVARTGTDTWTGTATDTVTNASHHIGTYTVPADSGNLMGWYVGFVEYYLGVPSCSQLLRSDVVFGAPTSTNAGGPTGTSKAGKEYADCIGQAGYQATQVGNGTHVVRGSQQTRATTKPAAAPAAAPTTPAQAPAASGATVPAASARAGDPASEAATPTGSAGSDPTSAPAGEDSAEHQAVAATGSDPTSAPGEEDSAEHQAVAATGSNSVLPESVGAGAGALVVGGAALWAVRRRNKLSRSTHR
ncbi:hypothetical protein OG689_29375 [Kitasatospora sp. NBC_00240]|uniref:DUF3472 domain-containing protein n=1 Tax=Kitasatospora sp. NBC_00240 TaxID=2903567 RepID=UPI00225921DE|nr:hypothetical protein [Kitasatospora sp. NBC_00240]MCX5213328.1 hypothetical protein [Kitasatospora sp. NBC_00240]